MIEQEFIQLEPGDIVHHPSQPNNVWTVVGKPCWDQYSFLVVSGRWKVGNQYLWCRFLKASDEKCQELARRYDMKVTRMINSGNWDKEHSR